MSLARPALVPSRRQQLSSLSSAEVRRLCRRERNVGAVAVLLGLIAALQLLGAGLLLADAASPKAAEVPPGILALFAFLYGVTAYACAQREPWARFVSIGLLAFQLLNPVLALVSLIAIVILATTGEHFGHGRWQVADLKRELERRKVYGRYGAGR